MSDSEEDDAHFCLRCKGTFIGLDQYIEHRKTKCKREDSQPLTSSDLQFAKGSTVRENLRNEKSDVTSGSETSNRASWPLDGLQSSSPSVKDESRLEDVLQPDILEMNRKDEILETFLPSHDNDSCLKAVDFFSILELQSSKNPIFQELNSSQKHHGGVVTRSKASAVLQAKKNKEYFTSKLNAQDYDYDYQNEHSQYVVGKDVIITDNYDYRKEITCPSKERKLSEVESPKSKSRNEDRILDDDGKSGQFFFQEVHNEVTIVAEEKPHEESDSFSEESEDEDEEDDEDLEYESSRMSTGGKWKPEGNEWANQPIWNSAPPASFTGGKWKPSPPAAAATSNLNLPSTSYSQQEDTIQEPQSPEISKARVPPPGHTRGKWLPTLDSTDRRFWCGPCNRRLSSLALYDKHCRSDLHRRRTRQEDMLEEDLSMDHPRPEGRRQVKRTKAFLDSDPVYAGRSKRKRATEAPSGPGALNTKKRGGALQCALCRCQVWPHLIGKHLVSHFHSRRARGAPELAGRLALEHIDAIVLQAPFQCATCRFFCNTTQAFLLHWVSKDHAQRDSQVEGRYCCPICRVECRSNTEMYQHLLSSKHKDSIAIINGSVPIVIQKKRILQCDVCGKEFRFNFELRQHSKSKGHPQSDGSASDKYQEREVCPQCRFVAFSRLSLQRHLTFAHKEAEGRFFCSVCDANFDTAAEAKIHRSTSDHKDTVLAKQGDKELTKVCCHCYCIFTGVTELKKHLKEDHPEMAYRCIKCGSRFTLKQELARHARVGCGGFAPSASFPAASDDPEPAFPSASAFQCPKCAFTSHSEAELLFHLALHSNPVQDGGNAPRYQCPSCPRVFLKSSLRKHLHSHTGERPYSCRVCGAGFARKDVLENHVASVHCLKRVGDSWQPQAERSKSHGCDQCGATFYDKSTLNQHRQIHEGKLFKCQEEGCVYSGRSRGDLQQHMRSHGEERPFHCNDCNFSTKTKAQLVRHGRVHLDTKSHHCPHCQFRCNSSTHLNRHLRLHTGAKPFHCPHCDFSCNLLENLRKHVLSTKKHPGKCLYSCQEGECPFTSNLAKEFRIHLVTTHGQSASAATSYVAGLYREGEDPRHVEQPLPTIYRKKRKVLKSLSSGSREEDAMLDSHSKTLSDNPTLASAVIPGSSSEPGRPEDLLRTVIISEPSDDVICIQLPAEDGLEGYDGSSFFRLDLEDHGGLIVIDEGMGEEQPRE